MQLIVIGGLPLAWIVAAAPWNRTLASICPAPPLRLWWSWFLSLAGIRCQRRVL